MLTSAARVERQSRLLEAVIDTNVWIRPLLGTGAPRKIKVCVEGEPLQPGADGRNQTLARITYDLYCKNLPAPCARSRQVQFVTIVLLELIIEAFQVEAIPGRIWVLAGVSTVTC